MSATRKCATSALVVAGAASMATLSLLYAQPDNNALHTEPRVARVSLFSLFAAAR